MMKGNEANERQGPASTTSVCQKKSWGRIHLKYLRAATVMNFSMKSSESKTAMWAARPMMVLAVLGRAWKTS